MLQADPKFTPQGTMHSVHSFTLIELLVVVAIIGILAAIAVPNFTDALVKCQIARTHADLKSLSHALEAYRIDHQTIPPTAGPFEPSYLERLKRLTTPVAYLGSLPKDPFSPSIDPFWETKLSDESPRELWDGMYVYNRGDSENGATYGEGNRSALDAWSLSANAPDRKLNYPYYFYPSFFHKPERYVYHVSNGLRSQGDIFLRSPNRP